MSKQDTDLDFDHWTVEQWLARANDLATGDDRNGGPQRPAWEQAVGCCVRAQNLEPNNPLVHRGLENAFYGLGVSFEQEGDVRNALAAYRRAQLFPGKLAPLLRERVANLLLYTGRYEEAIAECDLALTSRPHDTGLQHVRGTALQQLERYDEAIQAYDAFSAGHPLNPDVAFEKLQLLLLLARFPEALDTADYVLRIRPKKVEAMELRVCLLARLGRPDEARAALEALLTVSGSA